MFFVPIQIIEPKNLMRYSAPYSNLATVAATHKMNCRQKLEFSLV